MTGANQSFLYTDTVLLVGDGVEIYTVSLKQNKEGDPWNGGPDIGQPTENHTAIE